MKHIPIIGQLFPDPPAMLVRKAEKLAADLLIENQRLKPREDLVPFAANGTEEGPALIIDDLSEISLLGDSAESTFYQDRGRLRAGDGDVLVTCSDPVPGYDEYCRDYLGLGEPAWLRPQATRDPMHIAEATWGDRSVRRELVRKMRRDELTHIHPHMGTLAVWELAVLLHRTSHRPIRVLAPTPGVAQWANDKVAFTAAASRLFSRSLVPHSTSAWNMTHAAVNAREIAAQADVVGIKIPDSAGSHGNVVLDSARITNRSLAEIEQLLHEELRDFEWDGSQPLLVSSWESNVLSSPSAQLWIPADCDAPPIVEGLFTQATTGSVGEFVGNQPARLPHVLSAEIVDRCWLLGRLFQLVGYVGRCSFDLILLGDSLANSQIEFIECNGRWGGTSLPMTLMNRLFGDWSNHPYASHVCHVPGLSGISFSSLIERLGPQLFDARSQTGRFILYCPGRISTHSGVSVIGLGHDWPSAARATFEEFPTILGELIHEPNGVI